jgi:hypothetical protein
VKINIQTKSVWDPDRASDIRLIADPGVLHSRAKDIVSLDYLLSVSHQKIYISSQREYQSVLHYGHAPVHQSRACKNPNNTGGYVIFPLLSLYEVHACKPALTYVWIVGSV